MLQACVRFLGFPLIVVALLTAGAFGQGQPREGEVSSPLGGLGSGFGPAAEPVVSVESQFTAPAADDEPARLFVTAEMKPGWHIYSITQPIGGPIATKIELAPSEAFRLTGDFQAATPAKTRVEPLFGGLEVEEHYDEITWFAPIEFAPGVDPATLSIQGSITAQPCDASSCLPPQNVPFTARLGQGVDLPASAFSEEVGQPGAPARAAEAPVGAAPDARPGQPAPSQSEASGGLGIPWVRVKTFAEVDQLVEGGLDLDALEANVRDMETGSQAEGPRGLLWGLWLILIGFAGGIALNVMPCVLPVIGLKILSFVNQAGEDRVRAFLLNAAFSAGLISVFLLLASLAAGMNLQWGGQFQYPWFNVTMAVVVFAMGLSFVGIWEIPIPGFVGSGKAVDVARREGLAGAFFTGIITTLLATPCTGPGMAFAVTMVMSEPPPLIFAVFLAVGFGMASPYLLIGAYPRLVAFLPKPGAWMETFKQVMGFVLLATTVWILSFIHWPYLVPTIGMMFGVWGACWWIQRKAVADTREKVWAWIEAIAFAGLIWAFMFPGLPRTKFLGLPRIPGVRVVMNERWELATGDAARATVPPGRYTLMIDFTADWCLNCKAVEATVLETEAVRQLIERNHVVPVQFDMTVSPEDAETKRFVQAVRVAQPSLAILPARDPNRPTTILRGVYTQGPVLQGLREAGPSLDVPG
jgi:thiol:disulfide interchange protein DsbD